MNCDCVTKIDNMLLENGCGYRLATALTFDNKMNISVNLSVPTVWADEGPRNRRKQPPPVLCSFCPFCGVSTTTSEEHTPDKGEPHPVTECESRGCVKLRK